MSICTIQIETDLNLFSVDIFCRCNGQLGGYEMLERKQASNGVKLQRRFADARIRRVGGRENCC